MLALRLLPEGGQGLIRNLMLYLGSALFFSMVFVGWWVSSSKPCAEDGAGSKFIYILLVLPL